MTDEQIPDHEQRIAALEQAVALLRQEVDGANAANEALQLRYGALTDQIAGLTPAGAST